jgi:N-ethylmaleimide reductase
MSTVMSFQPLFTPARMGDLDLPNRIVMAPLTRMRAGSVDHVPTALAQLAFLSAAHAGAASHLPLYERELRSETG